MSDEEDSVLGTPRRSAFTSPARTPSSSRPNTTRYAPAHDEDIPPVPKIPMVDSGMMTEPWEPQPPTPQTAVPYLAGAGIAGAAVTEAAHLINDKHASTSTQVFMGDKHASIGTQVLFEDKHASTGTQVLLGDRHASTGTQVGIQMSDAGSQWHEEQLKGMLNVDSRESPRPISISTYSDSGSQYDPAVMDEKLAKFPSPPTSRAQTPMTNLSAFPLAPAPLTLSTIYSEHVEPAEPTDPEPPLLEKSSQTLDIPKFSAIPAPLVFSSIQSVDTEPIEPLSPRSPRRDAVIIPRDEPEEVPAVQEPETPKASFLGNVFGWSKSKGPETPIIAEDETRQSPSDSPRIETPESQRPFKELSSNTNERSPKKLRLETTDESSQTALTANEIDELLRSKRQATILAEDGQKSPVSPRGGFIPAAIRARKSQESIGSVGRSRGKLIDADHQADIVPIKRPSSAGSTRNGSISSIHPPLPADSKQVIAAAAQRTGSSSGAPGSMGPPLMPASAYRNNSSFRPRTPSSQTRSPSLRDGTTPRAMHSTIGAGLQSPTGTGRSRRSSVTSFASELDTRFNIREGVPMPHGMDPTTDPRMINAITQTMIGEYLWKYTRKAGRGAMSENRHRRYFWVHPYTRTLYWSDRDPAQAGRAELKAKSVPIEAVRVVTDDNPMPPGLHRKSLVIMTPGRAVKFTATTGQRHETWFNALSYLLLRTGDEDAEGGLTKEDIAEFNPRFASSNTHNGPPSLSSYNSRTTRNESPQRKTSRLSMNPQIAQNSTASRTGGTLSRLSNYLKPGKEGMMGSSRSRHSIGGQGSIYEASEVHDSAEDLRQMIEKQDRESDKLENVRACCDGKHDVGHLHSSTKGRHSHANTLGAASGSLRPGARAHSRTSVMRRTD